MASRAPRAVRRASVCPRLVRAKRRPRGGGRVPTPIRPRDVLAFSRIGATSDHHAPTKARESLRGSSRPRADRRRHSSIASRRRPLPSDVSRAGRPLASVAPPRVRPRPAPRLVVAPPPPRRRLARLLPRVDAPGGVARRSRRHLGVPPRDRRRDGVHPPPPGDEARGHRRETLRRPRQRPHRGPRRARARGPVPRPRRSRRLLLGQG